MTDYKQTLNLPDTAFAMRANLAQREPQMLANWTKADLYGQIRAAKKGKQDLYSARWPAVRQWQHSYRPRRE